VPRIEQSDWLETFVAVAELGSFSGAAVLVRRSQSRVSAHVAALETALGTPLVDRRHRPVGLTDAGEVFLPFARRALAAQEEGAAAVDSLTGVSRGRVVVGAHPSVSAGFLPQVLTGFLDAHPGVRVELSEGTTVGLIDGICSGRFHLAISSTTGSSSTGLVRHLLWREPYVVAVPADHPLTSSSLPLRPEQLALTPLIVIARPGSGVDPDTGSALARWALAPEVAWRTEQPQTLANLVKAGLGVGLINRFAMDVCETTGLAVLQVGSIAEGRTVALWRDPARYMSAATRSLHRTILDAPRPPGTFRVEPDSEALSSTSGEASPPPRTTRTTVPG